MTKQLMTKDERRASLIKAGVRLLASGTEWSKLSCAKVAAEDGVSAPLVFHIFGDRKKLHKAIKAAYSRG